MLLYSKDIVKLFFITVNLTVYVIQINVNDGAHAVLGDNNSTYTAYENNFTFPYTLTI